MAGSMFNAKIGGSVDKKVGLFDADKLRYAMRAMLSGMYLTMATAAGQKAADVFNAIWPGTGGLVNAFIFAFSLVFILFLGGELATSNMMYLTSGVVQKKVTLSKAIQVLLYCTFFNIVGAFLMAALFGASDTFAGMTMDSNLVTTVAGKIGKTSWQMFIDGVIGNIFVNTAIILYLLGKTDVSKIIFIIVPIFMFVFLGKENVAANFASFGLFFFSGFEGDIGFTLANVLREWLFAFLGNVVGGGLIMGGVYSWLNKTDTTYVD